jgi:small subunit ribosomal protein S1
MTTDPEEDFAALFEASFKTTRLETGRVVEGTIVAIGSDVAFVDVGSKGEATIALDELRDEDGALEAGVGDRIAATVVSTGAGIVLSRKLQRGAATARQIQDAFETGLPVEGKVERSVKGGYEVAIARQRAFCPLSQIDTIRHTDPAAHEGRVYTFRVIEYRDDGRKFVVSRRALLEAEQQARAAEVRRTIVAGAVLPGRVVSVRDFGAFVDLGGGVQGLLHVSEMAWARVTDTAAVVAPGQEVTVKVLRVDEGSGQIALGLRQLTADPWSTVPSAYEIGQVREGRVMRVTDFGAFVELEPGVEALAHASTFAPTGRPGGWSKTVTAGMTAAFEILSIDAEKKRIGVALVEEGATRAASAQSPSRSAIVAGARLTGKVERHEPFGVFVYLAPGATGLVPANETGLAHGVDIKKALPVGSSVDVIVLEVDPASRRIRLSCQAVARAEEAREVRDYAARDEAAQSKNLGTLADKLRGALTRRSD